MKKNIPIRHFWKDCNPDLKKIIQRHLKIIYKFIEENVDLPPQLYEKLFNYYSHEMPYGTQKARTGDPDVWIANELDSVLKDLRKK